MVTIYDVALKAGVSIATISRVMNSPNKVNGQTREKVINAMKELGYVPNMGASSIMTKKNKSIGVIIPDVTNIFFSSIVRGIQDRCEENGYSVIMANSDDIQQKEVDSVYLLFSHRVDGMILSASGSRKGDIDETEFKILRSIPTVLIDRKIDGLDIPTITSDNFAGGYSAGKYLLENGHREFLYLAGFDTQTDIARKDGFLTALHEQGVNEFYEIHGQFRLDISSDEVKNFFQSLEKSANRPTAIFAGNDLMAIGAIKALHSLELKVPEDISVIGYDNIPFSECTIPALTTINQPSYEMGTTAASCLLDLINNVGNIKQYTESILKAELIERDSVCNICVQRR